MRFGGTLNNVEIFFSCLTQLNYTQNSRKKRMLILHSLKPFTYNAHTCKC